MPLVHDPNPLSGIDVGALCDGVESQSRVDRPTRLGAEGLNGVKTPAPGWGGDTNGVVPNTGPCVPRIALSGLIAAGC